MVNAKIKRTLDELQDIIKTIKSKADSGTSVWNGNEKADIERRIDHLLDKSKPRHTNLPMDLEVDLKEIENDAELMTEGEIKQMKEEIKNKKELWDKITPETIESLITLKRTVKKDAQGKEIKDAQGNPVYEEIVNLEEVKTALNEIKDKKDKEVDLTPTNTKLEEVKKDLEKQKPNNYW